MKKIKLSIIHHLKKLTVVILVYIRWSFSYVHLKKKPEVTLFCIYFVSNSHLIYCEHFSIFYSPQPHFKWYSAVCMNCNLFNPFPTIYMSLFLVFCYWNNTVMYILIDKFLCTLMLITFYILSRIGDVIWVFNHCKSACVQLNTRTKAPYLSWILLFGK